MPSPPESHNTADPQQGALTGPLITGAVLTWKQEEPHLCFRWQAPLPVWPLTGRYTHDFKDTSLRWVLINQTLSSSEMAAWWHFYLVRGHTAGNRHGWGNLPKGQRTGWARNTAGEGEENGRVWVFSKAKQKCIHNSALICIITHHTTKSMRRLTRTVLIYSLSIILKSMAAIFRGQLETRNKSSAD